MLRSSLTLFPCVCLALIPGPVRAAEPAGAGPCRVAEYQQFDFWLGDWKVYRDGRLVGYNRVERILNGCAVRESYRTARGFRGTSLSIYDQSTGRWHQTWVDNEGRLLQLDGQFRDGRMMLSGDSREADGSVVNNRITWSVQTDGHVRQLWEVSRNGGAAWETAFDGVYRTE